jgi:hypothetical protein
MTHLERKLVIPYNFALVYDEWTAYRKRTATTSILAANALTTSSSSSNAGSEMIGVGLTSTVQLFTKKVCLKAFEQLLHRDLIRFADHKTGAAAAAAAATAAASAQSIEAGGTSLSCGAAHSNAPLAPQLSFPTFATANNAGGGGVGGTASYTQKEFRTVRLTVAPEHIREYFAKNRDTVATWLGAYAATMD